MSCCQVTGCAESAPGERLMCQRHWQLTPANLRGMANVSHFLHGPCGERELSVIEGEAIEAARARELEQTP